MACAECFQGTTHNGTPTGHVSRIHDLDVYVSWPNGHEPASRGIIVVIPDAFGWSFINNRLLADRLAEKSGLRVYLPDFMRGHPLPPWMLNSMRIFYTPEANIFVKVYHMLQCLYVLLLFTMSNRVGRSHPVVTKFFAQLRQSHGSSMPIGAAGYCWGGKHVVMLAQKDSGVKVNGYALPLVDAGFAGHPAWLEVPGDLEKLKRPTAFALAEKDTSLPMEEAVKIKIVVEALPEGARGEARIYENCGHGFCSRADYLHKESEIAQKVDEAERQCVDWFDRHFRK